VAEIRSRRQTAAFADFLRLIAAEAGRFAAELIPVAGENGGGPQGMLVLDSALAEKRKRELADSVAGGNGRPAKTPPLALLEKAGGQEGWRAMVQTELGRVKTSRLPCALLLIRLAGGQDGSLLKKAAALLETAVPEGLHLGPFDHATLALLLPGASRKKALLQARAIHHCLCAAATRQVKIGLAVCLAHAVPGADEFMAMASRQLHQSGPDGGGIFYCFQEETADSCQVTAEERAQLFRFAGEGKKRAL
jgi:hypothetical protein